MPNPDAVNILVVDDLPDKLLAIETVLEGLGQKIVTARSGPEALRLVLDHDFAVILLDVNMPEMDGFETASLIRQRRRCAHTPIIFITAFGDDLHTNRGYSLGAVDYILSPVVPEILRTKVGVFVELFKKTELVKRHVEERIALAQEQTRRAAAEAMTWRSQFLAEASRVLTSSLNLEATVAGVTRLVVPSLTDVGIVLLGEASEETCAGQMSWRLAGGDKLERAAVALEDLPIALARAVQEALASGKGACLDNLDGAAWTRQPREESPAGVSLPAFDSAAVCVFPLMARGRTLGALCVARYAGRSEFDSEEQVLVEDLAGRAAIALDNARLYQNIQEADQRKNEFLAMLAHELRNPLAPIRNALQILRLDEVKEVDRTWAMDVMDRQLSHIVRLVNDLLEVSRITRGNIKLQREHIEASAIVAQAMELSRPFITERQHEVVVSLPNEPIWLDADPLRLAQALTNLLNNAAKYTEQPSKIQLEVETGAGDVLFRVRDRGVGIPVELLPHVFELFFQADRTLDRAQGGLGIGLTLVRRLVELHGGTVRAYSAGSGAGSEFVIRLPGLKEKSAGAEAKTAVEPMDARLRRILIVDDNPDAALSLGMVLKSTGHEVRIFNDGSQALEAAPVFRPDVVVLDLGMPRMDGYEVARRLRGQSWFDKVALVAVSGYGQDQDLERSANAGFRHHLVKPVDPKGITQLIATL